MPTDTARRHIRERTPYISTEKKRERSPLKHLQKVYPIGIYRSSSGLSDSPLSLSQNSSDSSLCGSFSSWDRKFSLSLNGLLGSFGRKESSCDSKENGRGSKEFGAFFPVNKFVADDGYEDGYTTDDGSETAVESGEVRRCSWITKSSDDHYVSFHDECWGVPVHNDSQLFELLSLSGMLIDQNWAEIIRKKDKYREAFQNFDPDVVARMEEKEIQDIGSIKELMLAENRVRCIVDNAKCILKVVEEFGSFSSYIWNHVNYRPTVNRYRYPQCVPIRTPKSEIISKELLRRGFRLVGPVIVYSFMQAAGMAIDHLTFCFRFNECVKIAQRSCERAILATGA